jgi:uncharacterized membrane protein YkoI
MLSARALACLLALAFACAMPAGADDGDRDDAERARRGALAGEFLPLAEIAGRALDRVPGRLIEVELDEDDGLVLYEIKILQRNGRVVEVELDARSGQIIDVDEDE